MKDEYVPRIRWKDFPYYEPIRLIITDWNSLKRFFGFMAVPSQMEYKGRKIELCLPYYAFVHRLEQCSTREQQMIIKGNAVIELMKTYMWDRGGMAIKKVEPIGDKQCENTNI